MAARTGPAQILIADDHTLVRQGLRLILDAEPDLLVVAEVGDGAAAVQRVREGDIDQAILDVSMPLMTGLQAAREIAERGVDVKMLILSMYDNEQYLFEALKIGAAGTSTSQSPTATSRPRAARPFGANRSSIQMPSRRSSRSSSLDATTAATLVPRCHLGRSRCSSSLPKDTPARRSPTYPGAPTASRRAAGRYTIIWGATSADSHPVAGAFKFTTIPAAGER